MITKAFAVIALLFAGFLAYRGREPIRRGLAALLTIEEWLLLGKLIGIVGFIWLLVQAKISMQYPAEMFIYGRF